MRVARNLLCCFPPGSSRYCFEIPGVSAPQSGLLYARVSTLSEGVELKIPDSLQPDAGESILECSLSKRSRCSSPFSAAPGSPSVRPLKSFPTTPSPLAIWCSSGLAPILNGKPPSSPSRRSGMTEESPAPSCGRTEVAGETRGSRIAPLKYSASAAPPSLNQLYGCKAPVTGRPARVATISSANLWGARRDRPQRWPNSGLFREESAL